MGMFDFVEGAVNTIVNASGGSSILNSPFNPLQPKNSIKKFGLDPGGLSDIDGTIDQNVEQAKWFLAMDRKSKARREANENRKRDVANAASPVMQLLNMLNGKTDALGLGKTGASNNNDQTWFNKETNNSAQAAKNKLQGVQDTYTELLKVNKARQSILGRGNLDASQNVQSTQISSSLLNIASDSVTADMVNKEVKGNTDLFNTGGGLMADTVQPVQKILG